MAYYAKQRLRIGSEYREIGQEVSEAATWPDVRPYLDGGQLEERDSPPSVPGAGIAEPEPKDNPNIRTAANTGESLPTDDRTGLPEGTPSPLFRGHGPLGEGPDGHGATTGQPGEDETV